MNKTSLLLAFALAACAGAAQAAPAACPDGAELTGLTMQVTLNVQGKDNPLVIEFAYDHCQVEIPRDEPPAPPYTYRAYKSAKGDVLGVYSNSERPASTVSLYLADGSSSASMLPILATPDLASGRPLDLGELLLVKTTNGFDGFVHHATASIKSVPTK